MDEEISRWILEFLVRQPVDDNVLDIILSKLPLRPDDSRLKKALLLRRIRSAVSNGAVSDKILEMLELVRNLDFSHGKVASESMKMAYCAVAVDCTVRFLEEEPEKNGDFYQAMKRIWKVRVRKIERSEDTGLISEKLLSWRDDLKAAIRDREICDRLLSRNTRNEALKAVKGYLVDAWKDLGPSFLEKAAAEHTDSVEKNGQRGNSQRDGNDPRIVEKPNDGEEKPGGERNLPVDRAGEQKGSEDQENAGVNHGLKACDGGDGGSKHGNEDKIQELEQVLDHQKGKQASEAVANAQRTIDLETQEVVEIAVRHRHVNLRGILKNSKRAKIADPVKTDEDNSMSKTDGIPSPEVSQVKEVSDSGSKEPQRVSTSPLSDALHAGPAAMKNPSSNEAHVHNADNTQQPNNDVKDARGKKRVSESTGHEDEANPVTAESSPRHGVPSPKKRRVDSQSAPSEEDNGAKVAKGKMANSEGPVQGVEANPVKPSLMERKPSAHTYKWEELWGSSAGASPNRPYMPSPKRRTKRRWTSIEEETLREGVKKFGKGNWKLIQQAYRDVFETRSEVDLKDKWRNLTRR